MSQQTNCDFCEEKDVKKFQVITVTHISKRCLFHMCEECQAAKGLPLEKEQARSVLDSLMDMLVEEVTEQVQENLQP